MYKRNVLNTPRLLELKKKRRKILIRKIAIILIVFALIFGGLSYISRIQKLNIVGVETTGNTVIDTEKITSSVEKIISGKYLWLFPKTNILIYPENKIEKNLGEEFKRLTDITVSVGDDKKLLVSVNEREPEYMWCGDAPTQNDIAELCYFLDKEGYIFDEAPYFSGEVYFKFYGKLGKDGNPSGVYLAEGYFDKLIIFKDALTTMELIPVVIYIEEGEDLKILLSKKSGGKHPEIILRKDSDFEKVAENLKAVLSTEPLLSRVKNEYSKLEYIDLRFGNKVYYKFK